PPPRAQLRSPPGRGLDPQDGHHTPHQVVGPDPVGHLRGDVGDGFPAPPRPRLGLPAVMRVAVGLAPPWGRRTISGSYFSASTKSKGAASSDPSSARTSAGRQRVSPRAVTRTTYNSSSMSSVAGNRARSVSKRIRSPGLTFWAAARVIGSQGARAASIGTRAT